MLEASGCLRFHPSESRTSPQPLHPKCSRLLLPEDPATSGCWPLEEFASGARPMFDTEKRRRFRQVAQKPRRASDAEVRRTPLCKSRLSFCPCSPHRRQNEKDVSRHDQLWMAVRSQVLRLPPSMDHSLVLYFLLAIAWDLQQHSWGSAITSKHHLGYGLFRKAGRCSCNVVTQINSKP